MRAYSYIRWSTPEQMRGDSLRRQAEASAAYCQKRGWVLDNTLSLRDLGVSAFRGKNAQTGALAGFLDAVRQGAVKPGSALIVESLDRLSRNQIMDALRLFSSILEAGVKIITLVPEREYTSASVNDIAGLLEPIIIMARAHEESATKSKRLKETWQAKRRRMAEKKLTGSAPGWLRLNETRTEFAVIPSRAATVRRIFRSVVEGTGIDALARTFNKEGVPTIGRAKKVWHQSYVAKILKNRAVLGEYQPHHYVNGKRVPIGQVQRDYFPAVVDEATWYRAQAALTQRCTFRGRKGKTVANLFSGLLRNASDGCTMRIVDKRKPNRKVNVFLVSSGAYQCQPGSRYVSFPYHLFEFAFLAMVRELKPLDMAQTTAAQDRIDTLEGRFKELSGRVARLKARVADDPDFDGLLDVLAELERSRKATAAELERAKAEASGKAADELAQAQDYVDAMLAARTDAGRLDVRTRLRSNIRQLVSEMWIRIAVDPARPQHRVADVQVAFRSGGFRWLQIDTDKEGAVVASAPFPESSARLFA